MLLKDEGGGGGIFGSLVSGLFSAGGSLFSRGVAAAGGGAGKETQAKEAKEAKEVKEVKEVKEGRRQAARAAQAAVDARRDGERAAKQDAERAAERYAESGAEKARMRGAREVEKARQKANSKCNVERLAAATKKAAVEQEEWKKRRAKREAQAREEAAIAEEAKNETRRQDQRAITAMGFDAQLVAARTARTATLLLTRTTPGFGTKARRYKGAKTPTTPQRHQLWSSPRSCAGTLTRRGTTRWWRVK